ncbi:class I SAM-dependent methyltransferase [Rhodococcus sp. NPDC058521]|uniref:class I SAM-dependent methyltransferase n=1 Tax=Rhodococcus sp. NPDC058521 TaxID=3346536 RepID=UPI003662A271
MTEPDLSFLAAPDTLADWRMVLSYEAVAHAGVLDELPGTCEELADSCTLDARALRTLLTHLCSYEILALDGDGIFTHGPAAPQPPHDDVLLNHAATIRRWSTLLGPRLRDRKALPDGMTDGPPKPARPRPDLLAINARRLTGTLVDECVRRFPQARRVLDLGGGHGEHALEFTRRGLSAVLQDLPAVLEAADRDGRLSRAGIELFPADLFTALPGGPFDLVLCSTVTNMFDEAANRDLYRRLRGLITRAGRW